MKKVLVCFLFVFVFGTFIFAGCQQRSEQDTEDYWQIETLKQKLRLNEYATERRVAAISDNVSEIYQKMMALTNKLGYEFVEGEGFWSNRYFLITQEQKVAMMKNEKQP